MITDSGKDVGDEARYNIEKLGGNVLRNFAPNEYRESAQQVYQETDAAHPQYALAKGLDILGAYNHKRDNASTGGAWRTRPTVALAEKWLQDPELLDMFAGEEEALNQLKIHLDKSKDKFNEMGVDANSARVDVPLGGGFNTLTKEFLGQIENVGNIGRGSVARQVSNLNPTIGTGTLTGKYQSPGSSPSFLNKRNQLAEKKEKELAMLPPIHYQ